jgi:hypothetical protein
LPVASPATTVRKPFSRTRVTNGKDVLPGVDGRTLLARRYQDLVANLTADAGGDAGMSEARRQLIRRFAALAVLAESTEARLALGEPIDLSEYCSISSTLVRLASRLGLNRAAKLVPQLRDYIEAKAGPGAPPHLDKINKARQARAQAKANDPPVAPVEGAP